MSEHGFALAYFLAFGFMPNIRQACRHTKARMAIEVNSIPQFTLLFITVGVRSSNDVLIAEDTV